MAACALAPLPLAGEGGEREAIANASRERAAFFRLDPSPVLAALGHPLPASRGEGKACHTPHGMTRRVSYLPCCPARAAAGHLPPRTGPPTGAAPPASRREG